MEYPYKTPQEAVNDMKWKEPLLYARYFGIDNAHIYRAKRGDFTPTFVKALRDKGLIPPARKRCRITGDSQPETRDAMRAEADRRGITMGELIDRMWDLWQWATSSPSDTPKP